MTQQDNTKKQESKQEKDDPSKKDLKNHPGTKTMEQVEKPNDPIANPDNAQGQASDGDTISK
jgi:hypothetical protein